MSQFNNDICPFYFGSWFNPILPGADSHCLSGRFRSLKSDYPMKKYKSEDYFTCSVLHRGENPLLWYTIRLSRTTIARDFFDLARIHGEKSDQVSDLYPVVYAERGGLTLRWLAPHGSLVRRS
ncbi:hypothetical protein J6590_095595 [Homalodisca vitripennis]|nr:hypothetical protein J6590_090696 [Homalodisca vitripennis]KAG8314314.1 hypothetical protein J6590_095595 [Homalodisca vitripennis]